MAQREPDPARSFATYHGRGLRAVVLRPVREALDSSRFPDEQYTDPPGDPGLFGPHSAAWHVHADPTMLVGGLAALTLQTLHPLAMAGVADHSDYRERPAARLSRVASFIAATTYASTPVAMGVIDTVKAVHRRVVGTAPDGRPYRADDPQLLRWVHVAEVYCFLQSHLRYHRDPLQGEELDRYYAETAVVAELLGATEVPASRSEVGRYFERMLPELAAGEQARATVDWILTDKGGRRAERLGFQVLARASVDLVPAWAREMLGLRLPLVERALVRPAAAAIGSILRYAGGDPLPIRQAHERCAATPSP